METEGTETKRFEQGQLTGLGAFMLAEGCSKTWLTLSFAGPMSGSPGPLSAHEIFDIIHCAAMLIIVVAVLQAKRNLPLGPLFVIASVGLMGSSLVAVMPHAADEALPLGLQTMLGGAGFAAFVALEVQALAQLTLVRIALFSTAPQVLASFLSYLALGLSDERAAIALCALPLFAMTGIGLAYHRASPSIDAIPVHSRQFSAPWKLFVLIAVCFYAYGMQAANFPAEIGTHSTPSTAVTMGALFLTVYFFSDRISLGRLCRALPLLILCGFLLVPWKSLFGNVASSFLISGTASLMNVLIALILYDICKRFNFSPIVLLGLQEAMRIFVVAGAGTSLLVDRAIAPEELREIARVGLVLVLMIASAVFLFPQRELESKWGIRFLESQTLLEGGWSRKRLEERCDELTARHHLSPREEEVLRLYAAGKGGPDIARELFIAPGTVKTHTRHIYEKMGVASRKELLELLKVQE